MAAAIRTAYVTAPVWQMISAVGDVPDTAHAQAHHRERSMQPHLHASCSIAACAVPVAGHYGAAVGHSRGCALRACRRYQ